MGSSYSKTDEFFDGSGDLTLDKCLAGTYTRDGTIKTCTKVQCLKMSEPPSDLGMQPYVQRSKQAEYSEKHKIVPAPCEEVLTSTQMERINGLVEEGKMTMSHDSTQYSFVNGVVRVFN
jgi:hypothetical protein